MTKAALVVVAFLVVSPIAADGRAAAPLLPPGKPVLIFESLRPSVVLFGDTSRLRVTVLVNAHEVDPSSVRLHFRVAPLDATSPTKSRDDLGDGVTRIRFASTVRCFEVRCVPKGRYGFFHFPVGTVTYKAKRRQRAAAATFRPQAVEVLSRINQSALGAAITASSTQGTPIYAYHLSPPAPSYRASPKALAAASFVVALALIGIAVFINRGLLRRPATGAVGAAPREVSELDRAVALVQTAQERNDELLLRKALERVAVELAATGDDRLARDARELAWTETAPRDAPVADLVTRICGVGR